MKYPRDEEAAPLMPVRRLHNYVYCPRLFYLQWVENIFVENADTIEGHSIHSKVDESSRLRTEALAFECGALRSISVSSEQLGISGIVDLLEMDEAGRIVLVDYKKGYPQKDEHGDWVAKKNDVMQLAAYSLLLKENEIDVDWASIYYAAIKKHVRVELTDALYGECRQLINEAYAVAEKGVCPPPLEHDARCLSCSAYPICLPCESHWWSAGNQDNVKDSDGIRPPRPAADMGEVLVVQNPRASIGVRGGEIQVHVDGTVVAKHPIRQLQSVYLYGSIQVSAQALTLLMECAVPVAYFSAVGRFIGMANGLPASGVDVRMGQYKMWAMPEKRLTIASEIVRSKIHNQRVLLMRNGSVPDSVLRSLVQLRDSCKEQSGLAALRGVEGAAASLYFSYFSSMLKDNVSFDFNGRNRRPPRDPVNALLSLGYSVLVKELSGIAYAVGLDPYLGFFHSPRYGRPALALDMMEEFRPLIVDSVVLTMINRGEVDTNDFIHSPKGTLLKDSARRQFWRAWVRRLDTEITHPTFGYKMSYRRMMEVQMRQLWRFCRGDTNVFWGFTTR